MVVASRIGDADAVERSARQFQRAADRLSEIGYRHERWYADAVWRGPRADRARREGEERAGACRVTARELDELSRALQAHAAWIPRARRSDAEPGGPHPPVGGRQPTAAGGPRSRRDPHPCLATAVERGLGAVGPPTPGQRRSVLR